ncbi:hypothetical protein F5887DRAFT_1085179 [Amanita rubescens]|nr:hypothetical protein F5887DRAFT_1085179 [Amanita rubescens]
MLKVAFVLAALLAMEGVVFSRPVVNAHGHESSDIVPRSEPGIIQRRASDPPIGTGFIPMRDLYDQIVDSLEPSKQPHLTVTATISTRDLSDQEDIETRGYWDEDENHLARRGLDNELMEREYAEAHGTHSRHAKHKARQAKHAEKLARLQAEQQQRQLQQSGSQAGSSGNTGTAEPPNSTGSDKPGENTAGNNDVVTKIANHSFTQKLANAHPLIGKFINHPGVQDAARNAFNKYRGHSTDSSS